LDRQLQAPAAAHRGEPISRPQGAETLRVAHSRVPVRVPDGFIAGEQLTPGASWRIRITEKLRAVFVDDERPDDLPMLEATKALGVSRQTILQRVKRGGPNAIHIRQGARKGL